MRQSPPGFDIGPLAVQLRERHRLLAYSSDERPRPDFAVAARSYTLAGRASRLTASENTVSSRILDDNRAIDARPGILEATDDFPDAIADIRYDQAAYPFVANAGLSHVGFTAVYQSARAAVLAAVGTLPARLTLYITGHSQAAESRLWLRRHRANTAFKTPIVYTIASPRVGDTNFADRFDNGIGQADTELASREYVRPGAIVAPERQIRCASMTRLISISM